MIHDVILSCINLHSKHIPLEELLMSDVDSPFLHPCEKSILNDVIKIIHILRDVATFSAKYGKNNIASNLITHNECSLQYGLYIKAFANGIDNVLNQYFLEVMDIERRYLQNPTKSLLFVFTNLQSFEPLALFLRKLIRSIQVKKLHGCAILEYLHHNNQHGDQRIRNALTTIKNSVNLVFFKQLTHWILYAEILDFYEEFFIRGVDVNNTTWNDVISTNEKMDPAYGDIWRYEIVFDLLPNYLSASWAEKVLFIGQTVLIFQLDLNNNKSIKNWDLSSNETKTLWNDKETFYFTKMQDLQTNKEINISAYGVVIDEVKSYVTSRLSEIAVNQADLLNQMKLIKDFYLLGRGELFLEFIRLTYMIKSSDDHENKLRDFIKAYETAALSIGILDQCEQFPLNFTKSSGNELDKTYESGLFPALELKYKINWPLHLLFSPKVLDRYNILFRFLLIIKKIQYELHMLWRKHTKDIKSADKEWVNVTHFRNHLMFFIDNFQYYIQVDVLESQFSLLWNTINNKADFEQIQKAHSIFQANVFSLCFLAEDNIDTSFSCNPVYAILKDAIKLCEESCILLGHNDVTHIFKEIKNLKERFSDLMGQLIKQLSELKASPSTGPLSQLLLRLDFNHWFSLKMNINSC